MKNKKIIFFIINAMGAGGAEKVVSNILPELNKRYTVHLILLQDTVFYDIPKNIHLHFLSHSHNGLLMIPRFITYLFKTKNLIKKYNPHKIISFLEIANFVNILSNKNAIISFRTSLFFLEKNTFGKIYILIIRLLYPKAKRIIVNSKENKFNLIKRLNIPSNKITTIHNPINTTKIKQLKSKSAPLPFLKKNNQNIFITIGRFDTLKNISAIIKSFKDLSSKNILLIIGDGPEKKILQNLTTKYNLQKQIFFLGHQRNVYQYLNIADYFIFASKAEGFPNVLIEAMACNLPIITSDFKTGAREIINPELNFNQKIKYPYYGPNGILLSLNNFSNDFQKIKFSKLQQQKITFQQFKIKKISQQWQNIID